MINVTKSFLPSFEVYQDYLKGIWSRNHLTNHGPLVLELEEKLSSRFDHHHFFFVNNGTIALQLAIKALGLKGEIITTPFSYVATVSSVVWEQCTPVFIDICEDDFTIDEELIESAITEHTSAILATHVYGIPCHVEAIHKIAKKHNLKVIYDAAHAFDVTLHGKSIMTYGDISTLSFHATKLFHTVEGGGLVTGDKDLAHRISYMRNFGHNGPEEFWGLGINGKSSELHAAMGLSVLPHVEEIIHQRTALSALYDELLVGNKIPIQRPVISESTGYNYAYYPIVFKNRQQLISVLAALNAKEIFPRRYFYPSLNKLPYIQTKFSLPIAEKIAECVMCLPLYYDLPRETVIYIADIILKTLRT